MVVLVVLQHRLGDDAGRSGTGDKVDEAGTPLTADATSSFSLHGNRLDGGTCCTPTPSW